MVNFGEHGAGLLRKSGVVERPRSFLRGLGKGGICILGVDADIGRRFFKICMGGLFPWAVWGK